MFEDADGYDYGYGYDEPPRFVMPPPVSVPVAAPPPVPMWGPPAPPPQPSAMLSPTDVAKMREEMLEGVRRAIGPDALQPRLSWSEIGRTAGAVGVGVVLGRGANRKIRTASALPASAVGAVFLVLAGYAVGSRDVACLGIGLGVASFGEWGPFVEKLRSGQGLLAEADPRDGQVVDVEDADFKVTF